jgi:hypothetical protein
MPPLSPELDLHAQRETRGTVIAGVVLSALVAWWCLPELARMRDEDAITAQCERTSDVEIRNASGGGYGPFGWIDVSFAFVTSDDEMIEARQSIRLTASRHDSVLEEDGLVACYVRTDPTRVVLEPLVALRGQRNATMFFAALGSFAGIAAGLVVWLRSRRLRQRQLQSLRDGKLVRATVRSVLRNRLYHFGAGQTTVRFALAGQAAIEHVSTYAGATSVPLAAAEGGGGVAVVGGPGSAPVLLRADGFPFRVDERELDALAHLRLPSEYEDAASERATSRAAEECENDGILDVTEHVPAHARRASTLTLAMLAVRVALQTLGALALFALMAWLGARQATDALEDARAYERGEPIEATVGWSSRSAFGLLPSYTLDVHTGVETETLHFATLYGIDLDGPDTNDVRRVGHDRLVPGVMAHALVPRCLYGLGALAIGVLTAFAMYGGTARRRRRIAASRTLAERGTLRLYPDRALTKLPRWMHARASDVSSGDAPFVVESAGGGRHVLFVVDEASQRYAVVSFEGLPLALSRAERAALRTTLQEVVDGAPNSNERAM